MTSFSSFKLYVIAISLLLLAKDGFTQKVTGAWENAQIIETKKGFLIYALSEQDKEFYFNVKCVDKELNPVNAISKQVDRGGKYLYKVVLMDGAIDFQMRLYSLVVSHDLSKSKFYQWTKADLKAERAAYKTAGMDEYRPLYLSDMIKGRTNGVHKGNAYLELVHKNKLPAMVIAPGAGGLDYKGGPAIRGFTRNPRTDYQTYNNKWSVGLGDFSIYCFKWFKLDEKDLYLFISEYHDKKRIDFVYRIDLRTKNKVVYKKALTLDDKGVRAVFSNMVLDEEGNLIIVGNYYNLERAKKESFSMKGWFVMRLDSAGKKISEKAYAFDPPILPEGFDDDQLDSRCMSFQIAKSGKGKIKLMGENIRLWSGESTNYYQTYGVTYIELNDNLAIETKNYFETVYTTKDHEHGRSNSFTVIMYGQNIFELIGALDIRQSGNPMYEYRSLHLADDEENGTRFIYKQYEEDTDNYTYNCLNVSGPKAGEKTVIDTGKDKQTLIFFEKSSTQLYKFSSTKEEFSLEIIDY